MKIFITGHQGFIGSHLIERLQEHEISLLQSDLRDHQAVQDELVKADPEVIVHLAARTEVEQSFYEQVTFSEVNYVGTVNLIESARKLTNFKNFVFASTMEVYGWQPISDIIKEGKEEGIIAFDETTQPNPNAPYAVAKYGCEKYLEYANRSYGLPFTAIRQTNAYGRKDNDFFVTEQIITQMLKNPNEINLGYGEPYRNFIFIEDLLDAWIEVINNPEKVAGEILCLGPDNALKIKDYVQKIADKLEWKGTVNWDTKPERPGEIYLLNSSNKKITSKLNWKPKVTLDEGLDRTIEIWKNKLK
jgi:nucleoside-diphosphate-sugar epimerase|tara:strand:+ start:1732 stop:2640 length:909 start_codon:yes stop_codon:yes gene_type:complete